MTDFSFWAAFAPEGSFHCCVCLEYKPLAEAWSDELGRRWAQCVQCFTEAQRLAEGLQPSTEDNVCANAIAAALTERYGPLALSVRYGAARRAMETCQTWMEGG